MYLQAGQIILAPFLPTQAEVKKFELRSGYALLEVVLQDTINSYKALRITDDQLAQIQPPPQEAVGSAPAPVPSPVSVPPAPASAPAPAPARFPPNYGVLLEQSDVSLAPSLDRL